jgi:hypothetical protein
MWQAFAKLIFSYRPVWLLLLAAATAFMAWQARKVEMSFQMAEVLPPGDPTFADYQHFRSIFGEEANVVVMAVQHPGFYTRGHLQAWSDLEERVRNSPGIEWTLSPISATVLIKDPEKEKFHATPLIPSVPLTDSAALAINRLSEKLPFYEYVLWNPASNTYLMLAAMNKEAVHTRERVNIVKSLQQLIADYEKKTGLTMHVSGLPFIRTDSILRASKEITLFVVLAAVITSIVLFLFFKSAKAIFVPLINVGIAIVWSSGTMGLLGYKISILTGLIPPLLIVIGIPNAVYMITRYHMEFLQTGTKIQALKRVIEKTGRAIFLTNLTTAVGFGTMIITNSKLLVEFGTVSSLNIFFLFVISIILIPILFSYLPAPSLRHTRHLQNKRSNMFLDMLHHLVSYHKTKVYIVAVILFIVSLVGMSLIKTSGRVADDVPRHSRAFRDMEFFESEFKGVMPFEIMIDTKKKKGASFVKTKLWKRVSELQDSLQQYGKFSRAVSAIELIKFANQAYYNGSPTEYRIPNELDMGKISKYAGGAAGGDSLMQSYVDREWRYIRIRSQMADMSTLEMKQVTHDIKTMAARIFSDMEVDIILTGASILIMKSTDYLVKNLFVSLLVAISIIALVMGLMFGSFKMVIISLIPNIIPLMFTAAIMGFLEIPLKASTSIIFSVAFGISVDDTIHYLTKYRQELKHWQGDVKKSVLQALRETGLSMSYTSIILFFGFSIFIASDFGGTVALGVLVSITLFMAMLTNLILLPSLLLTFNKKIISQQELEKIEEDE